MTGQTTSFDVGDDGDLQMGVPWPAPRFTDNSNGTVTDNLTGLVWTKNANCDGGTKFWYVALDYCNTLAAGTCGLTDGSITGDWRMPNIRELHSLVDFWKSNPALPTGHSFIGVKTAGSVWYWSSSANIQNSADAWDVRFDYGTTRCHGKLNYGYVWCVRDGQ